MEFTGEHLGPGQLGHFFVITSFIAALFSAFSYFKAAQTETKDISASNSWLLLGRNGFIFHTASIFGIFTALYYIISSHLFEYNYAWQHSSLALPTKYLLSCFWEGQEGSFLLWTIWHCVLGLVVMATARKLESRTMAIISLVQVALTTMLLGFYFGADIKVGSTPFMLLRNQMAGAPIFAQGNYMSFIKDGNGLNVLLQNYWMVIHPPVLFLGFASTIVPFAFVMAALWKRDYQSFIKPTIAWSLFAGAVLGTGIMMGGAWAYESLTFGGYWAWDPVENASLVPWLTLVAGLHTLLVYKSTGRTLGATFILLILTYLFVWYSTFLTRTGVLGDTSVHAFTGEGKSLYWHLLVVLGVLMVLSITLLSVRWKKLPTVKGEEATSSREFWMFIGSIILLLSAFQIIFSTSLPVWAPLAKKILNKEIAPPVDPVAQYNNIQVWVAIIVALLSASILYLKFKKTETKKVWQRLGITGLIGLVISLGISLSMKIDAWQYAVLMFAACFAVVANIYYGIAIQKGSLKKMGASIAHLGFALMIVGIILSSYKKEVISINTLGVVMDFGKKTQAENIRESRENVLLFLNTPVVMGEYTATYKGDSASTDPGDPRHYYRVDYERRDSITKKVVEKFSLYPDAFINPKGQQGLSANPSSKHYLSRDVFTFITSAIDPSKRTDTASYKTYIVHKGDSIYFNNGYMVFENVDGKVNDPRYQPEQGDLAVTATMDVYDASGLVKKIKPLYYLRGQSSNYIEDTLRDMGIYTRFSRVIPEDNAIEILLKQTNPKDDYIVLKAMVFPYINVLWLGTAVMVIGFLLSIWYRVGQKEKLPVFSDDLTEKE
ncbi:cytochrome c biogenesis protein CcsA [Taibaiella soli]|uniref:Cytochrome c assembly protein n=1 Tax=Taibaiella soli TaxID=1649169 RepID=A0A2W2AWR8_9BACT|nr:cytochrome c biogenesis protein CcsA [Taibaiella soli]PZF72424.1 cytochrome c assembly protein [Taibaiella soli]